ncbi:hypothetical protein C7M84_011291 [Penaeus vannamei]|uniref:Uncharacterized protein n=1 Tax=Penaeus vannamei TaxID=6689 RepID=A0A423UA98_PENVA|nr:hypothetical protein C7M84_011291 [Penaeus vannamei]
MRRHRGGEAEREMRKRPPLSFPKWAPRHCKAASVIPAQSSLAALVVWPRRQLRRSALAEWRRALPRWLEGVAAGLKESASPRPPSEIRCRRRRSPGAWNSRARRKRGQRTGRGARHVVPQKGISGSSGMKKTVMPGIGATPELSPGSQQEHPTPSPSAPPSPLLPSFLPLSSSPIRPRSSSSLPPLRSPLTIPPFSSPFASLLPFILNSSSSRPHALVQFHLSSFAFSFLVLILSTFLLPPLRSPSFYPLVFFPSLSFLSIYLFPSISLFSFYFHLSLPPLLFSPFPFPSFSSLFFSLCLSFSFPLPLFALPLHSLPLFPFSFHLPFSVPLSFFYFFLSNFHSLPLPSPSYPSTSLTMPLLFLLPFHLLYPLPLLRYVSPSPLPLFVPFFSSLSLSVPYYFPSLSPLLSPSTFLPLLSPSPSLSLPSKHLHTPSSPSSSPTPSNCRSTRPRPSLLFYLLSFSTIVVAHPRDGSMVGLDYS